MSVVRPKILVPVTVPDGGWDLDFKISNASSLDTSLTATIPAGEYFVAWDWQTNDLVYRIAKHMRDAISGAGLGTNRGISVTIGDGNRLQIRFVGTAFNASAGHEDDVKIEWSTSHAGLIKAVGSDGTDWTSTSTNQAQWVGDYQHAYAWYASEDYNLDSLMRGDFNIVNAAQTTSMFDGATKTVQYGSRYVNSLSLAMMSAVDTWSDGRSYGDAESYGLERNRGLECWWMEARKGTRFRVYRNEKRTANANGALLAVVNDTASTDYVEDTAAAYPDDKYAGMHVLCEHPENANDVRRFYVLSNDDTSFYSEASTGDGFNWCDVSTVFYVHDARYHTYIIDMERMQSFAPTEIPQIDRYDIGIPMKRYVE